MRKSEQTKQVILMLFCAACLMAVLPLQAGDDFNKTGTTGFVFMNLPAAARSAGMGETGIAMSSSNADGVFINPALIAYVPTRNALTATFGDWYLDTQHNTAAFTRTIPFVGTVGVSVNMLNFGEMSRTRYYAPEEVAALAGDENNIYQTLGSFSAGAYTIGLSYARQMTDKFGFGATMKFVREYIAEYYAQNVCADLGFVYHTGFSSIRVGAFLKNFGLESAYVNEKFKMPQQMTLGISFEALGSQSDPTYVTVNVEAVHPNDMSEHINIGVESRIANLIRLRAGYKFGYEFEDITVGIGLHFIYKAKVFNADVAYMHHDYLGDVLKYTLTMEL